MNEKRSRTSPRKIALLILIRYFKKRKSLKDIINSCFMDYKLSELDKRFIFNIVKGTVRCYLKIDFVISLFSDKEIKSIDFKVLNILRMGIYQLMYMDKVPDYSSVNESVELAKRNASVSSSKFVNAILRRISSVSDLNLFMGEKTEELSEDEAERISINYSYPGWLVKYWTTWYGKEKTVLICRSLNQSPHTYLRLNKNKITRKKLLKELNAGSRELINRKSGSLDAKRIYEPLSDIEAGSDNYKQFISHEGVLEDAIEVSSVQDISGTNVYRKGMVSVQDISSQIAVKYFLRPRKGEKILDLCAAPGGKTAYIAELTEDKAEVVSVDISRKRLKLLQDNMERLNIKNVRVIEANAAESDFLEKGREVRKGKDFESKKIPNSYNRYFDKILIDAPCSAFGTISKNPDVKYNKTMDDIIRLSAMSYMMMVNSGRYLKAGGKLIFYTCTLSPIENQQVINRFLEEFKGKYTIVKSDIPDELMSILNLKKEIIDPDKKTCLEIMPYYFESEAGFVCSLIKNS